MQQAAPVENSAVKRKTKLCVDKEVVEKQHVEHQDDKSDQPKPKRTSLSENKVRCSVGSMYSACSSMIYICH